ncbi:MAG: hypothetical protein K9J79_01240 [Desulfobacteraceae bacterium]|nr:hypothetical protein [Desulfobacteraceae bacterium]
MQPPEAVVFLADMDQHQLYLQMEENVPGSFLDRPEWQELMKMKRKQG